jgi:hypothetical protein
MCAFLWEKTTKRPIASVYTNCKTALAWIAMITVAIPASAALHKPVQTTDGTLQGVPGKDPSVTVFRGVPYAAPPAGNLRWRPPFQKSSQ